VNVNATIKTGDSCAVSNTINFKSTSLVVYSSSSLSLPQIQFNAAQTAYFGATLQTDDYDVNLLTLSVRSVCVIFGAGPCTGVNFTSIAAVGGKNVAFSVSLSQLKSLKLTSNFESFQFLATIDVTSINNKRSLPVTAVVNVGSTIFINIPIETITTTGALPSVPKVIIAS
jgi:hypothetical protein